MENIRNRINVKFIQKCKTNKLIKAQTKLSFDGIHHVYENYVSYMLKNQILKMEKPIYLGFSILELSNLLMYETYYDKLQQYYGIVKIMLSYMDIDSFILKLKTNDLISDLENIQNNIKCLISVILTNLISYIQKTSRKSRVI